MYELYEWALKQFASDGVSMFQTMGEYVIFISSTYEQRHLWARYSPRDFSAPLMVYECPRYTKSTTCQSTIQAAFGPQLAPLLSELYTMYLAQNRHTADKPESRFPSQLLTRFTQRRGQLPMATVEHGDSVCPGHRSYAYELYLETTDLRASLPWRTQQPCPWGVCDRQALDSYVEECCLDADGHPCGTNVFCTKVMFDHIDRRINRQYIQYARLIGAVVCCALVDTVLSYVRNPQTAITELSAMVGQGGCEDMGRYLFYDRVVQDTLPAYVMSGGDPVLTTSRGSARYITGGIDHTGGTTCVIPDWTCRLSKLAATANLQRVSLREDHDTGIFEPSQAFLLSMRRYLFLAYEFHESLFCRPVWPKRECPNWTWGGFVAYYAHHWPHEVAMREYEYGALNVSAKKRPMITSGHAPSKCPRHSL